MKSINFINPVPPKKHREVSLWLSSSLVLSICVATVLGYYSYSVYHVQQEHEQELVQLRVCSNQLETCIAYKKTTTQQRLDLQERIKTLSTMKARMRTPHTFLSLIADAIPQQVCLTHISGAPEKEIEIEGVAKTARAITQFLKNLQSSNQANDIHLAGLKTIEDTKRKTTELTFTLKGIWHHAPHTETEHA